MRCGFSGNKFIALDGGFALGLDDKKEGLFGIEVAFNGKEVTLLGVFRGFLILEEVVGRRQ